MITTNYSQANVTLSGNVSLPLPTTTQEIINISNTCNAGYQTVRTIGAGKVFYLYGIAGSFNAAMQIDFFNSGHSATIATLRTAGSGSISQSSPIPIKKYVAGETVEVNGTNGAICYLWGVEVTA